MKAGPGRRRGGRGRSAAVEAVVMCISSVVNGHLQNRRIKRQAPLRDLGAICRYNDPAEPAHFVPLIRRQRAFLAQRPVVGSPGVVKAQPVANDATGVL
jgi:hypothetical protein